MEKFDLEVKKTLDHHRVTPSADLWAKLDDRLEKHEELVQQKEKEEEKIATIGDAPSRRWLFTSIAASIALTVGLAVFVDQYASVEDLEDIGVLVELDPVVVEMEEVREPSTLVDVTEHLAKVAKAVVKDPDPEVIVNDTKEQKAVEEVVTEELTLDEKIKVSASEVLAYAREIEPDAGNVELYIDDQSALYQETKSNKKDINLEERHEEVRIEFIPGKKRRPLRSIFTKKNNKL